MAVFLVFRWLQELKLLLPHVPPALPFSTLPKQQANLVATCSAAKEISKACVVGEAYATHRCRSQSRSTVFLLLAHPT